ncbi:translation initiation factor IF-2 subunit gamma [Candidatus Woesearchaeota archaeon]|nr:translation initiation factor IF-2 subunit gamma [Candidatus Woesearchaeota archaeon]
MAKVKPAKQAKVQKQYSTEREPEISIGMIGHVDHGKTTLVQALSGKWTDTHSEEIKRGITIRLGYADISIYKCKTCSEPEAWGLVPECPTCKQLREFVRAASLVDAPGHESLMATMLCGANIMDAALLLVGANEPCPQPQTKEHVQAMEIIGIKNIIVVQNKIDLVSEEQAQKNHDQIVAFLKGTPFENAPIIPIAAMHKVNIDALIAAIQQHFPTPKRDPDASPIMHIARSFDINKPGSKASQLVGGVLGGALKQGVLKKGQEIEILPGYETEEKNQKVWKPLTTTIVSIMSGGRNVEQIGPGGSMALLTSLDPSIVKSDKLVGSVAGLKGTLPKVWSTLTMELHLLTRVVGSKDDLVVEPLKPKEILMLNVNAAATVGVVGQIQKNSVVCALKRPVAAAVGSRVAMSRRHGTRWRLIGYGIIRG